MKVVAQTSITPDYTNYLYYTKGGDVYSYNKKSKSKKVEAKNAFTRQEGYGYVLKKSSGGTLNVVENSLAALRSKRRKKKAAKKATAPKKRTTSKPKKATTKKATSSTKKKKSGVFSWLK